MLILGLGAVAGAVHLAVAVDLDDYVSAVGKGVTEFKEGDAVAGALFLARRDVRALTEPRRQRKVRRHAD